MLKLKLDGAPLDKIDFVVVPMYVLSHGSSDFEGSDYCHSFDQRRERYIGEGGSKPG